MTVHSPIGTPNLWQLPSAMSAPMSPGGVSIVRARRSVAMATNTWDSKTNVRYSLPQDLINTKDGCTYMHVTSLILDSTLSYFIV